MRGTVALYLLPAVWHLPLGVRDDDPFQDAQELVYDGWDALSQGEVDFAAECFEEALRLDDMLADAHNGLAEAARSGDEDAQRQWRHLVRKRQSIEDTPLGNPERRRLLEQMP
ncbi:MAG: hypothetical protein ABEK84_00585 [Salinibacter sp.]